MIQESGKLMERSNCKRQTVHPGSFTRSTRIIVQEKRRKLDEEGEGKSGKRYRK
jgi:hypothetical protein